MVKNECCQYWRLVSCLIHMPYVPKDTHMPYMGQTLHRSTSLCTHWQLACLPVYGRLWTPWYGRSPHLRLDSGRIDADIDKATSGRSLHLSLLLSGQPWCLASMKHTASTTFDSNVPNSKKKKHIGQTNIKNTETRSVASENSREMRLHADQIRWALTPPFFGPFFSAQQYGLKSDKSL